MKATAFIHRHAWAALRKNSDALALARKFVFDVPKDKNRQRHLIEALNEAHMKIQFILDTVNFIDEDSRYRSDVDPSDRKLLGEVQEKGAA